MQSAEVMLQPPGQLCLSCQFANGSSAKGCLAEVAELNLALSALRPTDGLNASKCTDFSANGGSFQVLVYDIEADGTRSNSPAVTTMIFVAETGKYSLVPRLSASLGTRLRCIKATNICYNFYANC